MFNALSALVLALLPLASYAQDNDTAAVLQDLMNAKIIPDVIPAFTPLVPLDVVFTDNSGNTFPVTAGANLTINRSSLGSSSCGSNISSYFYSCRDCQRTVVRPAVEQFSNHRRTIPHGYHRP